MNFPWKVLIVRKRIKNMYIRIRRDGTVSVTVPAGTGDSEAEAFIRSKEDWICRMLDTLPEQKNYEYISGELHYVFGRQIPLKIFRAARQSIVFTEEEIRMELRTSRANRRRLYAAGAAEVLAEEIRKKLAYWVPRMRVQPAGFTVKAVKSRWGSCNIRTGQLVFALDLVTKPKPLIESVVVHELNHLLEPTHNQRFYDLILQWMPDYRERKKALSAFPREFL